MRSDDEEPPKPPETFAAGDHVRHPRFGQGIVVSCEPSAPGDYQIVIAFQGEPGIKKLLLSFDPPRKALVIVRTDLQVCPPTTVSAKRLYRSLTSALRSVSPPGQPA